MRLVVFSVVHWAVYVGLMLFFFFFFFSFFFFFFFNDTATTEIYTLSLHDALPICPFFFTRSIKTTHSLHAAACLCSRWN